MIRKTVRIEFVSQKTRAVDHLSDIQEAIHYAQGNLWHRHHIILRAPFVTDNFVFVELDIPEDIADNFNVGRHLRGISKYLLSEYEEIYKKYLVKKQLFDYIIEI